MPTIHFSTIYDPSQVTVELGLATACHKSYVLTYNGTESAMGTAAEAEIFPVRRGE